jgi:hypothetical protein
MAAALAVVDSTLGWTPKDPVQTIWSKQGRSSKKIKLERKQKNDEEKCVVRRFGDAGNDCDAAAFSGIAERHGK